MSFISDKKTTTYSLLLTGVVIVGCLPFLNHAFHIYEPLFLVAAEHLHRNPGRPYDFSYIWGSDYQPMYHILNFPPLFAYYLAGIRVLFGPLTEILAHVSIIPFSLTAALAFYGICKQSDLNVRRSFLAAAFLGACPAFVVSSNLATPDMAALAFILLAWYLAVRGWKEDREGIVALSGLALGLGCLTRYNLVPILLVFFLLGLTYRSALRAAIPSLVALSFILTWIATFLDLYNSNYVLEVLGLFLRPVDLIRNGWSTPIHLTLAGGFPFLVTYYIFRKSPLWTIAGLLITLYAGLAFYYSRSVPYFAFFPDSIFFGIGTITIFALFFLAFQKLSVVIRVKLSQEKAFSGYRFILAVGREGVFSKENFRDLIYILWFGIALFFPSYFNLFPNKFLLLGLPPLLLVLFKHLPEFHPRAERHAAIFLPCYFLISLVVARADFNLAAFYREEAETAAASFPAEHDKQIWFIGHWGWQYYMEKNGYKPLDTIRLTQIEDLYPGDLVIGAKYNSPQNLSEEMVQSMSVLGRSSATSRLPIRTMNTQARAGLHSDLWGPLPFSFSKVPLERFSYYIFQQF